MFRDRPYHDKYSHAADAFRYLALIADQESAGYAPRTQVNTEFELFPTDRKGSNIFNA